MVNSIFFPSSLLNSLCIPGLLVLTSGHHVHEKINRQNPLASNCMERLVSFYFRCNKDDLVLKLREPRTQREKEWEQVKEVIIINASTSQLVFTPTEKSVAACLHCRNLTCSLDLRGSRNRLISVCSITASGLNCFDPFLSHTKSSAGLTIFVFLSV